MSAEETKAQTGDKAATPAAAAGAKPVLGSQMTDEQKAASIAAAKEKAAATKGSADAPAAAAPADPLKPVAGGLALKKGEKPSKEEVIARALEKIRDKEKAEAALGPAPEVSRRELLLKAGWAGFTGFMAFLGGCTARYFFPRVLFEPPARFKAGFPREYSVGEVSTRFKDTNRVWIVQEPSGFFYAIFARCTHLGCTPMWLDGEQKFKCPCHGSGFTKEAINYEGPAPRPMERAFISLSDDGQILIDTSKRFKYEEGQWDLEGAYLRT